MHIRVGFGNDSENLFIRHLYDTPACPWCDDADESAEHILASCYMFSDIRDKFYNDVKVLMGNSFM